MEKSKSFLSNQQGNIQKIKSLPLFSTRRHAIVFLVVLVIVGLLVYQNTTKNRQKVQYQTAVAERDSLISTVTASGKVSSANAASISTNASGLVKNVFVKNGDSVQAGQSIAELILDRGSQQKQAAAWASYLSAQNSLNSAKSKMDSLQANLFTANQVFVKGAGTQTPITDDPTYIIQRANWLQAEADYNNQKGVITQAEASLASAWLSYSQTSATITAPMSGVVSNLTISPGVVVTSTSTSSDNTTTTSSQSFGSVVVANGKPQAVVNLSEIDVTKVAVGQKATLTLDAFSDKTFTGKITNIDTNGAVSSGVTTYPATIAFDSAVDKMYPNMAISATIITKVKDDVVLVPTSAIQTTSNGSTVSMMKNNQVISVNVETGDANDTQTEILSGITEGETVITGSTATGATTTRTQTGTSPFGSSGFGGGAGAVRFSSGGVGR